MLTPATKNRSRLHGCSANTARMKSSTCKRIIKMLPPTRIDRRSHCSFDQKVNRILRPRGICSKFQSYRTDGQANGWTPFDFLILNSITFQGPHPTVKPLNGAVHSNESELVNRSVKQRRSQTIATTTRSQPTAACHSPGTIISYSDK
ncbi:hypothetical protein J6590_069357 [Homalodisca vitripennis]|nr:hypothetical protein J6590_069357 [Homalodisca vitripennis]